MAAISPTQVSGKHNAIYEAYYKQVDPKGVGAIEAQDAAKFLKKSGLSDVVLSRIWDLSDPKGRGCLDKAGLFVALKLVSLAQAGHDINMRNILMELPNPPKVGEIPKIIQQSIQSVPVLNTDWSVKQSDRQKYESLFESLQPENGFIAGNKVKGVLMDSKLPLETLGKIWDLADQDKDGSLDKHEFIVAMHLVYQALEKRAIPSSLPQELQKPKPLIAMSNTDMFGNGGFVANFPKDIAPPPVPPLPSSMITTSQPKKHLHSTEPIVPLISSDIIDSENTLLPLGPPVEWVVPKDDQLRFGEMFRESDKDKDGLVSGFEVKSAFLQSGVPQNCLAHIWALCDTKECGKLTFEQFALAMWMVERKKKGIEPPESLTPNMMPPSLRTGGSETANQEAKPAYTNPELEMISKEIEELAHERRILETDIAQKEADIRIKSGEVRSLQSELDTLTATLKQLENQKGEAQKRLDDLKAQKIGFDEALGSVNKQIDLTRKQVQKIREQCQKQEATINEQESELNSKRSELQKLKDEETALEREYDSNRKELDMLAKQSQDTQLQISQIKAMVTQLLETQRQMNDALLLCRAAIEANDAVLVSDYSLKIEPDFQEAKEMLEKRIESKIKPDNILSQNENFNSDPFNNVNGFGSDPFSSADQRKTIGFNDSFSNPSVGGFDDAFTGGFASDQSKNLFPSATADPFGDKTNVAASSVPGKDEFGNDPFAILHAPTSTGQVLSGNQKSGPPPRPESPSPALPPKKSKQPPPRPAPPRPLQGPTRPAPPTTDAFESSKGFADFADFDTQQSLPLPSSTTKATAISDQPQEPIMNTRSMQPFETLAYNKTTTSAAIDFAEDPFKDYRYEDVFNITDPFSEQDDGDLSADGMEYMSYTKNSNKCLVDVSPKQEKCEKIPEAPKNNNFKLDDNYNATKALSTYSNNGENNNFLPTTIPLETNFANFDEFGASERTTPKLEIFNAFSDDSQKLNNQITNEIFSAKTKVPLTKPNTLNSTITSDINLYNMLDDKFEESFSKSSPLNKDNQKVNESTTKNLGKFNAFGDNFETDFSNTKSFNNNINDSNNNKQNTVRLDMRNASSLSNKSGDLKMSEKFLDDYSSTDKFGSDLETVLQRSLVDQ